MNLDHTNRTLRSKKVHVTFLILISFFVNSYYANLGVFPLDTFLHFDSAYRILNGESPIKDYWVVHGIFIDYLQAFLFRLFGLNWNIYVMHASLFNLMICVFTYFFLINLGLNKNYSFLFGISLALLGYTSSGTPFIDHHAAFLCFIGIFLLVRGIREKNNWILIIFPFFFGFAFLSKQVPTSYIIISTSLAIFYYTIIKRNYNYTIYPLIGSILFILFLSIFFYFEKITYTSFFEQYILFPMSIGSERYSNFNVSIIHLISHFKFIIITFMPILIFMIIKIKKSRKFFKEENFFICLIFLTATFGLIFHQVITNNQTFIFFLIPINAGLSIIFINKLNLKKKNIYILAIFLVCFASTFKYHMRFNEGRKFHELASVNLKDAIPAKIIDKKLKQLQWITPHFIDPKSEVDLIKKTINIIENDNNPIMLISNYLFLDALTKKNLNSPSRTYDSISFPMTKNKYYYSYKKLLEEKIKNKQIKSIYIFEHQVVSDKIIQIYIYQYLNKSCFMKNEILPQLIRLDLTKCQKI